MDIVIEKIASDDIDIVILDFVIEKIASEDIGIEKFVDQLSLATMKTFLQLGAV